MADNLAALKNLRFLGKAEVGKMPQNQPNCRMPATEGRSPRAR
jgi:hypothetical protein